MAKQEEKQLPFLPVLIGTIIVVLILSQGRILGRAGEQDLFRPRVFQCETVYSGPQEVVRGGFNTEICLDYFGSRHEFVIDRITHNSARVLWYGDEPKLLFFNPGLHRTVDLDKDGEDDVQFTLVELTNQEAAIGVQFLHMPLPEDFELPPVQEAPAAQPAPEEVSVTIPSAANPYPQQRQGVNPSLVALVGIILLIVIMAVIMLQMRHHD